jgi:hypothetical protein
LVCQVLIADLTAKSVDESLSTVKRNTAKAQLAQVQHSCVNMVYNHPAAA